MRRFPLPSARGLVSVAIVLLISLRSLSAATGEENLLLLHNGGMICGIMPQIGGRVVVFRQESGDNVLDARPELWKDAPTLDLLSTTYKQYYGESVWAGPQAIWWTADEPYPPPQTSRRLWPPDPAWELAPFTIVEQTPTRVVLRSPISKLTGLELTKTIELFDDGQLRLQEKAVNRGDKVVTRDLWLLHRVNPTSRCFFPLKSQTADFRFIAVADFQKIRGLDVMQLKDGTSSWTTQVGGKLSGVAQDGWMASSLPGAFFVVRFQPSDETKMAPDQAPVEVYFSSAPKLLCELEHHGEIKTLQPGEAMESQETWQIIPYAGAPDADAQAQFLQSHLTGESTGSK